MLSYFSSPKFSVLTFNFIETLRDVFEYLLFLIKESNRYVIMELNWIILRTKLTAHYGTSSAIVPTPCPSSTESSTPTASCEWRKRRATSTRRWSHWTRCRLPSSNAKTVELKERSVCSPKAHTEFSGWVIHYNFLHWH